MKWYNSWWLKVAVIGVIIAFVYFLGRKTIIYLNYQEILKTEIDSLKKENIKLDSLYIALEKQKQKVTIIRQNISTKEDQDKIKALKLELTELRKKLPKKVETITPEELDKYFQDIINKK